MADVVMVEPKTQIPLPARSYAWVSHRPTLINTHTGCYTTFVTFWPKKKPKMSGQKQPKTSCQNNPKVWPKISQNEWPKVGLKCVAHR